jgi:3-hydroxybutyrate dehydrogenase
MNDGQRLFYVLGAGGTGKQSDEQQGVAVKSHYPSRGWRKLRDGDGPVLPASSHGFGPAAMACSAPKTSSQELMMVKGRTVLVTGSTSGIGLGIADAFAAEGANVVINGFGDAAAIERERAGLEQRYGIRALYDGADVSKWEPVEAMVARAESEFGSVDVVVNNAGIQHVANVEDFPIDKWDAIIATNLSAAFFGTRAALPGMRKRGWGRVINIASAHGLVGSAQKSAYVAAKHGVIGLTKVAALETAGTGITVNAICPGWVKTPLVEKQIAANAAKKGVSIADAEHEMLEEKQPSLQFVTPQQIGGLALFLCSEAAAQITGAPLSIDGGWTAR